MGEIITLDGLRYEYRDGEGNVVTALDGISAAIREGEFVAVIGANGSGKSTLARHFNALLTPTTGRCLVAGMDTRDAAQLWHIRQTVGMVFQNPDNQIVAAVVEEDAAFGPENLGLPPQEIRRRVSEALAMVDMTAYRHHAPHLLSGGQKQRIAIAGVLAMRPRCLVLDEPTAMLDPRGRSEVLATVRRLHRQEGITVVYITHFMEEAVLADRVWVLAKGQLVMQGTPRQVFSRVPAVKALGLDVPLAAELAYRLRRRGVALPADIISDEELVTALCP